MVLYLESFDVSAASFALTFHVAPQFRGRHLLGLLAGDEHLIGRDGQGDIERIAASEALTHAGENTAGIGVQMPVIERIVVDTVRRNSLNERFAFKMLDGAAIADITAPLE